MFDSFCNFAIVSNLRFKTKYSIINPSQLFKIIFVPQLDTSSRCSMNISLIQLNRHVYSYLRLKAHLLLITLRLIREVVTDIKSDTRIAGSSTTSTLRAYLCASTLSHPILVSLDEEIINFVNQYNHFLYFHFQLISVSTLRQNW